MNSLANSIANYAVTFVDIASTRVADLQSMMNTVISAEHGILLPILKALVAMYITRQILLVMWGHMSVGTLLNCVVRALVITFLLNSTTNFNTYVVNNVFTNTPQILTNLGVGSYTPGTAGKSSPAQFDAVSASGDALAAQIRARSTCWSSTCFTNSGTAYFSDAAFQVILCCIFAVWFLGLNLIAIALVMGQLILLFEFFDRTRGFVDQWIGKLVGFGAFGFATSIVLAMQMQGMQTMLNKLNGLAGTNVDAAVSMFTHAIGSSVIDLLMIIACPVAFGFGSGAVAALAAPSALMAARSLSVGAGVAKGAGSAAARGASAVGQAGSRAISNARA